VCSLSPFGERVGVRGIQNHQETLTPHPTPLPMGERIDMQRQKILVSLQVFMLISSPSSYRRLHVGSISSAPGQARAGGPMPSVAGGKIYSRTYLDRGQESSFEL
jgi:hypothetical protein